MEPGDEEREKPDSEASGLPAPAVEAPAVEVYDWTEVVETCRECRCACDEDGTASSDV